MEIRKSHRYIGNLSNICLPDELFQKCRVCLDLGIIPIHGSSYHPDMSAEVRTFGDIKLHPSDSLPSHLCKSCYKLLQGAITFRSNAKQSDHLLRQTKYASQNSFKNDLHDEMFYSLTDSCETINVQKYHKCINENSVDEILTEQVDCSINETENKDENEDVIMIIVPDNKEKDVNKKPKLKNEICQEFVKESLNNIVKSYDLKNRTITKETQCPICKKKIKQTYLKHHMKRIHYTKIQSLSTGDTDNHLAEYVDIRNPESNKHFVCDKCGKIYKRLTTLKFHAMTHTNDLKYKCMFCPYKSLHQALLKIHVRTHTGDYNYKCPKCPAKFITKSNLSIHLKRHRGPIDFKCDKCPRGFYSKLGLERHHKVDHLGIKNHICNICGLAFGYRNGMMNHQLKVHKREKLTKGKGRLPNYLIAEFQEDQL